MASTPFDYIRVSLLPNIGLNRGKALLQKFGSFDSLTKASIRELLSIEGIQRNLAEQVHSSLHNSSLLAKIEESVDLSAEQCERDGIRFVTIEDDDYPSPLRRIYDPPMYLFMKGSYEDADLRSLAIVGTRQPSDYGRQATVQFADALAEAGVTIVSGLALGIDTIAHHRAVESGGRTLAVLGSGVNVIYPFTNKKLAQSIIEQGCLISEFLPSAKPDAMNFPKRNRLISGLSLGTLVIEAGARSGATLTAKFAFDQSKDVFAVPGNIYSSKSEGTNDLVKNNIAALVTRVEDIYTTLDMLQPGETRKPEPAPQLTMEEGRIMEALSLEPSQIDTISLEVDLPTSEVLIQLLQLEFKGLVRQLPGMHFVLSKM
jgi:DNA processing protein